MTVKKTIPILFCLILAIILLPLASAPARAESEGDWDYYISGNTATVSGYSGAGGNVTIPSTLGGKQVTTIGRNAFSGCSALQSVAIPNSVTDIGSRAFYGCDALKRVNISDLAAWCSMKCASDFSNPLSYAHVLYLNGKAVTKLVVPDGVTAISAYAFSGCSTLRSVSFPASVTEVGACAFAGCDNITRVDAADLASWSAIEFADNAANPLSHTGKLYVGGYTVQIQYKGI